MEGEIITVSNSSQSSKPVDTISILVVDDDTTCLSIIAAILKKCKYEVVTVKNPIDALYTLRIKGGSFDLVVSDVHMPDMNGFELQQAITEEFNLPVVLMSADDKEGVMMKGLETGAAYFITKPISPEDVRDLWQYAALKKKNNAFIDETENNQEKSLAAKNPEEIIDSASSVNEETQAKMDSKDSSVNEETQTKMDSKRRSSSEDGDDKEEENVDSITSKKPKVVWTNALHNRFLEAIRSIGLDRAVPKKILELMKVPGLTRENVASHLQKYRIFLRRVSDASYTIQSPNGRSLTSEAFQPNHASGNRLFMLNKFGQICQQNPEHQALRSAFQRKTGKHALVINNSKFDAASLSNQEASSSNSLIQSGFRQSHLLCNRTNTWKPTIGNTIPLFQPTRVGFGMESNNLQAGLLSHGQISSGLTNTRSAIGTYLPVTQAASDTVSNSLYINSASTLGASNSNYIPAHRRTVTSSATNRIQNPNLNTTFAGYQLANIEHLAHKEYQVADASTCLEGINGLIDEIQNGTVTAATMSNSQNTGQLAQCVSPGEFGGDNQYSATLAGGIPEAGVQLLPPTPSLHNSFGNGRESDPIFSPAFDMSAVHNISTQQSLGLGDISSTLFNQFDIQSPVQNIGGEGKMSSTFDSVGGQMDNALPWFDGTSSQQGQGCLVDFQNCGAPQSQLNNTLPSASQHDDDEFLDSLLASGPFEGDENREDI